MGCCISSPHNKRAYLHNNNNDNDNDHDIEDGPIRHFGIYRNNSNVPPNDIDGIPSTHIMNRLASNPDIILYDAEIDQGQAFRCCRPIVCILCPLLPGIIAIHGVANLFSSGFTQLCTCDEWCCWVRKEYSTRTWFRIYPNRVELNEPKLRLLGVCGCGSWNSDNIKTHMFDRGTFGFRRVHAGVKNYVCCLWPLFGGVVARQRCPCNGPLWGRMFTDCKGWWCDEWPCDMMCCSYRYYGLADADEVAFAGSIALQAYFEGRPLTKSNMNQCVEYWKNNVSEKSDPVGRRRDVCCESFCCVPIPQCTSCYFCIHKNRDIPDLYFLNDTITDEVKDVYHKYGQLRRKQSDDYKRFHGPVHTSTLCRRFGCRRVFGRRGFIFCTEGCNNCGCKANELALPFDNIDFDDDNDASKILSAVLGPPPKNVMYTRWEHDKEKNTCFIKQYHYSQSLINPRGRESSKGEDLSVHIESSLAIE
jgi:hypothetical protein